MGVFPIYAYHFVWPWINGTSMTIRKSSLEFGNQFLTHKRIYFIRMLITTATYMEAYNEV